MAAAAVNLAEGAASNVTPGLSASDTVKFAVFTGLPCIATSFPAFASSRVMVSNLWKADAGGLISSRGIKADDAETAVAAARTSESFMLTRIYHQNYILTSV